MVVNVAGNTRTVLITIIIVRSNRSLARIHFNYAVIYLFKCFIFLFFFSYSEVEQSLAALISDRATDEVVDALTRYRRGLGITDSPSMHFEDPQTPDVVRSRTSRIVGVYLRHFTDSSVSYFFYRTFQDTMDFVPLRTLDLSQLDSPTVSFSKIIYLTMGLLFVLFLLRLFGFSFIYM